jgi:hypothetical protein
MADVDFSRVPEYFHGYIKKLDEGELLETAFRDHPSVFVSFLQQVPEEKWGYRYAPGKWSIREVVQHVIDAERVFCYRALSFARKDKTPLPGFDENVYALSSGADNRSKNSLLEELAAVQKASALLFGSFNKEQMEEDGVANGKKIYVKAIGFIIAGHSLHHQQILKERYL